MSAIINKNPLPLRSNDQNIAAIPPEEIALIRTIRFHAKSGGQENRESLEQLAKTILAINFSGDVQTVIHKLKALDLRGNPDLTELAELAKQVLFKQGCFSPISMNRPKTPASLATNGEALSARISRLALKDHERN